VAPAAGEALAPPLAAPPPKPAVAVVPAVPAPAVPALPAAKPATPLPAAAIGFAPATGTPASGTNAGPQLEIGVVVRVTLQSGQVPVPCSGSASCALQPGPGSHAPSSAVHGVTSMPSRSSIAATWLAMFT
jgi:hypothetical protein